MASRIRSFVAVDVAPAVRFAVESELRRLAAVEPSYKWVAPEKMHLTLSFLGDVPDRDVPEICTAIKRAVSDFEEFELEVTGLGAFPNVDRPRVVWAGVGLGRESLCALQRLVAAAVHEIGFASERDVYAPHLTLGRSGNQGRGSPGLAQAIAQSRTLAFGVTSVDEVILYASYREKAGPSYVPMATFSLVY